MSGPVARDDLLARAASGIPVAEMFDHLPGVLFWVKDLELRFVACTQSLARHCGRLLERDIVGHTDLDFFPAELAEKFRTDDREVLRTGENRINLVELLPNIDGTVDWYSTNKYPVRDRHSRIVGVCGTTRLLERTGQTLQPYQELAKVLDHVSRNFGDPIAVRDLARRAGMSLSRLERRFRELFQITPAQYIIKVRLTAACKALAYTRDSVSQIANETGFYDASHFCRVFGKSLGITPTAYRASFVSGRASTE